MLRRFRFLTALLALLTLSAFGVEVAGSAVFCATAAAEQDAAAQHDAHGHDSGHDDGNRTPTHQGHCPIGMSGGGVCVIASLPAPAGMTVTGISNSSADFITPVSAHDQASLQFLFRPPRA